MSASTLPSAGQTGAGLLRAAGSATVALLACAAVSGGILYWLSLAEAGNSDLPDIIGILTLYAAATSIGAAVGVFLSALTWRGRAALWAGLIGPISATIGFFSKDTLQILADSAGLPRPRVSDFLVGALVSGVSSYVLYLLVWGAARLGSVRRAA